MIIQEFSTRDYMKFMLASEMYKDDIEKLKTELIKILHLEDKIDTDYMQEFLDDMNASFEDGFSFVQRFEYKGVEYGFIPNLSKISALEFIDLTNYIKKGKSLHKIGAILYRPVIASDGVNYRIEKYENELKYADVMSSINYKVILSAILFFNSLKEDLLTDITGLFDILTVSKLYKHDENVQIAKGKYELPDNFVDRIKKLHRKFKTRK